MKKIFKRKKLNNKGFTLIELLAVVVILAIVMGIAATSVLNSINNSRTSSLYSAAQNAANTLNTWVTEDSVEVADNKKHLGHTFVKETQEDKKNQWLCLGNGKVNKIVNRAVASVDTNGVATPATELLKALNISTNDIVTAGSFTAQTADKDPTCSAIRYNTTSSSYEILLVAKAGGKYYVGNDKYHYAYSTAAGANVAATNA